MLFSGDRVLIRFGWRCLARSRLRLAVTLGGVALAVFLMCFQMSLLVGFQRAASRLIRAAEGQIWISASGVPCFEFSATLAGRLRDAAYGVPSVLHVTAVRAGFATLVTEDGARRTVFVVGSERDASSRVPVIDSDGTLSTHHQIWVDSSNLSMLGVRGVGTEVEIERRRFAVGRVISGFGSFLGSPYVFTSYRDAARILAMEPTSTSFLVVRTKARSDVLATLQALEAVIPNATLRATEEFADQATEFWLLQTGAGGGILVAAVLGFVVGLAIVTQTMYAAAIEALTEFATLAALGASTSVLAKIILMQSVVVALLGGSAGVLAALPLIDIVHKNVVAWITMPWWVAATAFVAGVVMCGLASIAALRRVVLVDPVRAFGT